MKRHSPHMAGRRPIGAFLTREDGAILVEFGLLLPIMLLLLGAMIEGGRLVYTYQMTIAGVRDAARYLARTAPIDICLTGGSVAAYSANMKAIVEKDISGNSLFPSYVSVGTVTPSITCVSGSYRVNPAPVGMVSATLSIEFPFSGIMGLFGGALPDITTTVTDRARVFGQ